MLLRVQRKDTEGASNSLSLGLRGREEAAMGDRQGAWGRAAGR